ncbi:MAG: efflux transporter outer membrane subunit [Stenotrophomonas maltophilia]
MIVPRPFLLCLLATTALSGCAVGPTRSPRSTLDAAPSLNPSDSTSVGLPTVPRWWSLYQDPTLDALVSEALQNNRDLRVASANLAEAHAVLLERQDSRLPVTTVSSDIGYGSTVSDQIAAALDQTEVRTGPRYTAGLSSGWRLDLFGQIARSIQAAHADEAATLAAEDSVRVVVAAETTRAYLDSCGFAARAEVAQRSLAVVTRNLELKTALRAAGGTTSLDVARSAALMEQARAAIPAIKAARQNALYELAVLTGRPPDHLSPPATGCVSVPQLTAPIPIGDVTALLQRRPDIREAERRLEASTARIGVAMASLYPTVSILGSVASSAPTVDGMRDHGSIVWGVGPALSWHFPNRSAARAQIAKAEAQEVAALARFDAVILTALKDVKQALATYAAAVRRQSALAMAVQQSREAARLAGVGRRAGAISELDALDAQRRNVEAEAMLASAEADVASDQVALFRSLGGGWEQAPAVRRPVITRAVDAAR